MLNSSAKYVARFCVKLFICLQFLLPSALSSAASYDQNLSSLICAPSGQAMSSEAQSALGDLAQLLGETEDDSGTQNDHCDMCTLSHIALGSSDQSYLDPSFFGNSRVYFAFEIGLVHKPQGPPTGSRAPPIFI